MVDSGETDPNNFDTDGDLLPDGLERGVTTALAGGMSGTVTYLGTNVGAGHFIADQNSGTRTDPRDNDSDDDGISDGEEDANQNGAVENTIGGISGHPEAAKPTQ